MNKKTRLYIDTSVWNFVLEAERNEYGLTNNFLGFYGKNKNYQLVTSEIVEAEVNRAYDTRRKQLSKLLEKYKLEVLTYSEQAYNLA